MQLLLWPRFKALFDVQLSSVRSGTERTLFAESVSVHPVVKRYAALTSSMLLLMAEYDSDESGLFKAQTFYDMVDRLWAAMFDLMLRMSNQFKERVSGIIFLITNYAHVAATLTAADGGAAPEAAAGAAAGASGQGDGGDGAAAGAGKGGSGGGGVQAAGIGRTGAIAIKVGAMILRYIISKPGRRRPNGTASPPTFIPHRPYLFMRSAALLPTQECEDQLTSCTGLYVEDQLSRHFPILVEFVKKAEQQCKRLAVPEGQPIQG